MLEKFIKSIYNNTSFNLVSLRRKDDNDETSDKIPLVASWQTLRHGADRYETIKKSATGVGLRCGKYDAFNVLCIDFDTKDRVALMLFFDALNELDDPRAARFYLENSPHGRHVVLLHDGAPFTNEKLHYNDAGKCDIETRGDGGQVRIAPSAGCMFTPSCVQATRLDELERAPLFIRDDVDYILKRLRNTAPHTAPRLESPETALEGDSSAFLEWTVKDTAPRQKTQQNAAPRDFDAFAYLRDNPAAVVEQLTRHGYDVTRDDAARIYLRRPGTSDKSKANHSITVARDGGAVTAWSSNLNTTQGDTVSPANFLAREFYNNDLVRLARELRDLYAPAAPAVKLSTTEVARLEAVEEVEEPAAPVAIDIDADIIDRAALVDVFERGGVDCDTFDDSRFYNDCFILRYAKQYARACNVRQRRGLLYASLSFTALLASRVVRADYRGHTCAPSFYAFYHAETAAGKQKLINYLTLLQQEYNRYTSELEFVQEYKSALERFSSIDASKSNLINVNAIAQAIEEKTDDEKSNLLFCSLMPRGQFQTTLPATAEAVVTEMIDSTRVLFVQDEFQNRLAEKTEQAPRILAELVERFAAYDSQIAERQTRGNQRARIFKSVYNAYISLFLVGIFDDDMLKKFHAKAAAGFSSRIALIRGASKNAPAIYDETYTTDLPFDVSTWVESWAHAYAQKSADNARVEVDYIKESKKNRFIYLLPPLKSSETYYKFTPAALEYVDKFSKWIELGSDALHPRAVDILARKPQTLTTYSLLFACMRKAYNFGAGEKTIELEDVKRAALIVLEEIATLRNFIPLDVLESRTAETGVRYKQEADDERAVVAFIKRRKTCTKEQLRIAQQGRSLPSRPDRLAAWDRLKSKFINGEDVGIMFKQYKRGYIATIEQDPEEVKE